MTNIALVVLDTLRKDTFQEHFDWLPGRYFTNAWSTSHRTPPVHASLFTGRYGSEVGVVPDSDSLTCERPVLAELLAQNGYRTRAYSANPYISNHFNFDRGFADFQTTWGIDLLSDELFNWESFAVEHKGEGVLRYFSGFLQCIMDEAKTLPSMKRGFEIKLRDLGVNIGPKDDGAREVRSFIDNSTFGDDEFLFLNLMEAHEPYRVPEEVGAPADRFPTTVELTLQDHDYTPEEVRKAYDDSAQYLSNIYQDIFELLTEDFDIVITCGDHGELFGKRGVWGHFHGVDPELANVPLHIFQGESSGTEVDKCVSLLDVYSTILELAGVDDYGGRGGNLLAEDIETTNRLVECYGISEKRVKQIRHDPAAINRTTEFEQELYGAVIPPNQYGYEHIDGFETVGGLDKGKAKSVIDTLVSELETSGYEEKSVPSDVEDHLKDLGYV